MTEILRDMPPAVQTATARNVTGDLTSYLAGANDEVTRESHDKDELVTPAATMKKLSTKFTEAGMLLSKLVGVRDMCETVGTEVSSRRLNDVELKIREIHDRQVALSLTEARSLTTVTVKLDVDFESILKLQRKLSEYSAKRI